MTPLRNTLVRYSLVYSLYLLFASAAMAQVQSPDFSIIVLPDTQNESQYYPQVLSAETQWIANSQDALNIQAVLGLGDIVNSGSDNVQWANADAAFKILDQAQIPYFRL
jgi:hypothetical protein